MASWDSEKTVSSFNSKEATTNMISSRGNTRDISLDPNLVDIGPFNGYSVVGLNVGAINSMRESIAEYCSRIENHLNGIEPKANANAAFKSDEVQEAVSEYVDKVKKYCINLTSQLLAFSDKLADVRNAWQQGATNMSQGIKTSNAAFDAGTKYTETIQ